MLTSWRTILDLLNTLVFSILTMGRSLRLQIFAELLSINNPYCSVVTWHPHTLRDQNSIKSGNKFVQWVLKSIKSECIKFGLNKNWACFLGQVTSCCNNNASQFLKSVSSYKAIYEQDDKMLPSVISPYCSNVGQFGNIWNLVQPRSSQTLQWSWTFLTRQ